MAANAMILKEGVKRFCGSSGPRPTKAGCEEKHGREPRAKLTTGGPVSSEKISTDPAEEN